MYNNHDFRQLLLESQVGKEPARQAREQYTNKQGYRDRAKERRMGAEAPASLPTDAPVPLKSVKQVAFEKERKENKELAAAAKYLDSLEQVSVDADQLDPYVSRIYQLALKKPFIRDHTLPSGYEWDMDNYTSTPKILKGPMYVKPRDDSSKELIKMIGILLQKKTGENLDEGDSVKPALQIDSDEDIFGDAGTDYALNIDASMVNMGSVRKSDNVIAGYRPETANLESLLEISERMANELEQQETVEPNINEKLEPLEMYMDYDDDSGSEDGQQGNRPRISDKARLNRDLQQVSKVFESKYGSSIVEKKAPAAPRSPKAKGSFKKPRRK